MNKVADESGWNSNLNLAAYAEVETESNYQTPEALENYRKLLLQKSAPAASLIDQLMGRSRPLRVLELCSGSSRLLYALNDRGLLGDGYGVEVSPSRHRFAERWKADLSVANVHNTVAGVAEYHFPEQRLDVAVLIDGALSYLYPCDPELPDRVLRHLQHCLIRGGRVVMEFDVLSQRQIEAMRRDGWSRTWYQGDDKDAFRYALYQTEPMSWQHMVVQNTSIYLPRTAAQEKIKRELYKYYSAEELTDCLNKTGFDVEFFGSFEGEPFTPESTVLIAVATRRG